MLIKDKKNTRAFFDIKIGEVVRYYDNTYDIERICMAILNVINIDTDDKYNAIDLGTGEGIYISEYENVDLLITELTITNG